MKAPRLAANLRQLLTDGPARHFVEDGRRAARAQDEPGARPVLQDGGAPIHGIAQALAGDDWDEPARELLPHLSHGDDHDDDEARLGAVVGALLRGGAASPTPCRTSRGAAAPAGRRTARGW